VLFKVIHLDVIEIDVVDVKFNKLSNVFQIKNTIWIMYFNELRSDHFITFLLRNYSNIDFVY
jgi:hypothetical protein